jgi:hypothetical protein
MPVCIATDPVSEPLGYADLFAVLQGSADSAYIDPIVVAGDGNGLEVYGQAIAQLLRVSDAIERSIEAMYAAQWSGQAGVEASAGRRAQVPLLFSRSNVLAGQTIIFDTSIRVGELETDTGSPVGVEVQIERYYNCETPVIWNAGDTEDHYARGIAENVGYGYNNPRPNSLRYIENADSAQHNDGASVVLAGNSVKVVCRATPDVFQPTNVGQYLQITAGTNAGKIGRIVGYARPDPLVAPFGGAVAIERLFVARVVVLGTLAYGDEVWQPTSGAAGRVYAQRAASGIYSTLSIVLTSTVVPSFGPAQALYGTSVAAIAVMDPAIFADVSPIESPSWVAESGMASWRIVPWTELGVAVTNPVSPTGGRAAFLDTLGRERGIDRLSTETDEQYRYRVTNLDDVVSPMAIKRAISRICTPLGVNATFYEIGTLEFPGFFYDVPSTEAPTHSFAYDFDITLRPQDRFKTYMSLLEMRAFFMVEIEPVSQGDFGFAFDVYPTGAFDCSPYLAFFDGYSVVGSVALQQLWQIIDKKRAAGVSFAFQLKP